MFVDHGDRFTVPVICIQILMMDILTMMMGKQTLVIPTLTLVFNVGTDTLLMRILALAIGVQPLLMGTDTNDGNNDLADRFTDTGDLYSDPDD